MYQGRWSYVLIYERNKKSIDKLEEKKIDKRFVYNK